MKICIIGAGIAGLLSGLKLLDLASTIDIYERAKDIGARRHCTGIVSMETIHRIDAVRFIDKCFKELVLNLDGLILRLTSSKYFACRIRREEHEKYIASKLINSGCRLRLRTYVVDIEKIRRGFSIRYLNSKTIRSATYDCVIIAEGYPNNLSRSMGFKPKIEVFKGLQFKVRTSRAFSEDEEERMIVNYGFLRNTDFTWFVPIGRRDIFIGMITSLDAHLGYELLKVLIHKFMKSLNATYRLVDFFGGNALRGYPRELCIGNIFSVGDANAMVKSISCGGLYPISIAVDAIRYSVLGKDELSNKLINYLKTNYMLYKLMSNYLIPLCRLLRHKLEVSIEVRGNEYDNYIYILRRFPKIAP